MSETAAQLVDRVLPAVPVRQWVLSVPFELRARLAADPAALTLTARVLFEEMRRWYRDASGIARADDVRVEGGALTFVHRGGGSLNLNVHLHVIAADGVWRCATDGTTPEFVATRAPTRADLEAVILRVARRVSAGLERAGAPEDHAALDACRRAAFARGVYGTVRDVGTRDTSTEVDEARFGRRPPKAQAGAVEGFNLHASVVIAARDVEGRERLLRYVARPMVVGERVSELADGRIAWRLKVPGGRGETHRIMEPMEFMARLAARLPPPRRPLLRYHGVFAPHSPWRSVVVPSQAMVPRACEGTAAEATEAAHATRARDAAAGAHDDVWLAERGAAAEAPARERSASRIDWATLMHRVWGLGCARVPEVRRAHEVHRRHQGARRDRAHPDARRAGSGERGARGVTANADGRREAEPCPASERRRGIAVAHDSKPVRRTVGVYTRRPEGARPPKWALRSDCGAHGQRRWTTYPHPLPSHRERSVAAEVT
jgi:hypothetical protein